MSDKILVTGGTGFLGKHLVNKLVASGEDVMYTYRSAPIPGTKAVGIKLDLASADDYKKYKAELQSITHLVHAAANVPDRRSKKLTMGEDIDINVIQNVNILVNLLSNLPSLRRTIFISSCYAQLDDPAIGFYGVGKKAVEDLLHQAGRTKGIDTICLRFPQIYGPEEKHGIFVNKFVEQALRGQDIAVDNPYAKRDLVFIGDVVETVKASLKLIGQKTITVSSANSYSIEEVADTVVALAGKKTSVLIKSNDEIYRKVTDYHFQSDYQKYGFRLKYSLSEGIAATFEGLRKKDVQE